VVAAAALPATALAQATKTAPSATTTTYEAVVAGMACKQLTSGRLDCEYKVGTSLRFVIAGVGQQDAVVSFYQVDPQGEYVAGIAPLHGCVIVRPAQARPDSVANIAFVSPGDGKVYRNWNTCLKPIRR
jgi:hypothetical protein